MRFGTLSRPYALLASWDETHGYFVDQTVLNTLDTSANHQAILDDCDRP